ncbi:MAG: thiamine diphosphokinase [Coriobacteriia bacterium]|nr:thiamine diphosphokinase [Coriobacteriia bacterium]
MDFNEKHFAMLVSGSPLGVAPEVLWEMSEGMSFVVAVDSGAKWCFEAGVIPDLLIGDMDSIDPEIVKVFQDQDVETITFSSEKDATDFELAINQIIERGYSDMVATNVVGGRIDHELAAIGNLVAAGRKGLAVTVVETDQTLIFLSNPGARSRLQVALGSDLDNMSDLTVSLVAWGGVATVSAVGYKWELDRAELHPNSSLGVSNVPTAVEPVIEVHSGDLIVVVPAPAVSGENEAAE